MRRRYGFVCAALAVGLTATLAPAAGATTASATRRPVAGRSTGSNPADTPPSAVWSAARVQAGLSTAWDAPDTVLGETGGVAVTEDNDTGLLLHGLDAETGAARWTYTVPSGDYLAQTAVAGGRVYLVRGTTGSGTDTLLALDAATGAQDWSVAVAGIGTETAADGRLLINGSDPTTFVDYVRSIDPATGATAWSLTGPHQLYGADNLVYAIVEPGTTYPNGALLGLNPATGVTLWTTQLPFGPGIVSVPLSSGRFLLEFSGNPSIDSVYDGHTGALVWSRYVVGADGTGNVSDAVSDGGTLYEVSSQVPVGPSRIYAIDEATGQATGPNHWVTSNGMAFGVDVAVTPGVVFVGCWDPTNQDPSGFVCGFDRATGQPLSMTYVGQNPSYFQLIPIIAADRAIVSDNDGTTALTPAPLQAVPGKIEAESSTTPVLTTTAQDTGGGLLVGYFPAGGAVLDYPVDVASPGSYQVTFRVASAAASLTPPISPRLELQLIGVGSLATVNVPQTGGWQSWQSVSTTVTLPAGVHRLRIYIPAGAHAFNLNWFDVEHATAAAARTSRALPRTTAAQRQAACLAGLTASARLSRAARTADCVGA